MERIVNRAVISTENGVDYRSAVRELISPRAYNEFDKPPTKPIMTWAPSHVELGYLGEVLRYANIIDGLKENDKNDLRPFLAAESDPHFFADTSVLDRFNSNENLARLRDVLFGKHELFCIEKENEEIDMIFRGIELCPEYIDYLREILKPYM